MTDIREVRRSSVARAGETYDLVRLEGRLLLPGGLPSLPESMLPQEGVD